MSKAYLAANLKLWNDKTKVHLKSEFYDLPGFLAGQSSLNAIELGLLGDVKGKKILHLQCHFGQDSLSLARMGAQVTGIDLSDEAIKAAKELNQQMGLDAHFICCDVFSIDQHLDEQYDIIFTSYGVTGWLPSLEKWGSLITQFLKPGGQFLIVEFHPVVWMFDDPIEKIIYSYFNVAPIIEEAAGTYTDKNAPIKNTAYYWNHSLSDVFNALLQNGLSITHFQEYDYSPYKVLGEGVKMDQGYQIKEREGILPLVYSLMAKKA